MKYIRKSKDPDWIQLKTNFYSASVLLNQIKRNIVPVKAMIERCYGDIYDEIYRQVLNGELKMNALLKFDVLSQISLIKHSELMKSTKREYDNEKRRIAKKTIWYNARRNINLAQQ